MSASVTLCHELGVPLAGHPAVQIVVTEAGSLAALPIFGFQGSLGLRCIEPRPSALAFGRAIRERIGDPRRLLPGIAGVASRAMLLPGASVSFLVERGAFDALVAEGRASLPGLPLDSAVVEIFSGEVPAWIAELVSTVSAKDLAEEVEAARAYLRVARRPFAAAVEELGAAELPDKKWRSMVQARLGAARKATKDDPVRREAVARFAERETPLPDAAPARSSLTDALVGELVAWGAEAGLARTSPLELTSTEERWAFDVGPEPDTLRGSVELLGGEPIRLDVPAVFDALDPARLTTYAEHLAATRARARGLGGALLDDAAIGLIERTEPLPARGRESAWYFAILSARSSHAPTLERVHAMLVSPPWTEAKRVALLALVGNPACPRRVLEELAAHDSASVRDAAKSRQ
jgi:hypothetical protein